MGLLQEHMSSGLKITVHRGFLEGIVLYNILVFAVFYSIYHTIDFEKHFTVASGVKVTSPFLLYFSFLTHANAMCSEVVPRTEFARNLLGLHVLFSWGLFLILLAPWSAIPQT